MVVLNSVPEPPIVDVVLLIEDTALGGFNFAEIKTNYIIPTLEHFNGGPASDLDFASLNCSSSFSIVPFHASDCLPLPASRTIGPLTSIKKVLNILDKLPFKGGKGSTHSSGQEAIANALQLLKEVEQKRGEDVATARHIVYVCNSAIYDMPVMDNSFYQGRKLDDLTTEIQDKGIYLSVLAPRKLSALIKLFEKSGGDMNVVKEKNFAKDPRHLVLLNGYQLQERPITPKPSSVSPSNLLNPQDTSVSQAEGFQPKPIPTGILPGQPRAPAPGNFPQQPGVINPTSGARGIPPNILEPPSGVKKHTTLEGILKDPPLINTRPPVSQPFMPGMNQPPMNQQPPVSMGQQPPQLPQPQQGNREYIWKGELEWHEKVKDSDQKITHNVHCSVSTGRDATGLPEVKSDNWPAKLIMQLIPKSLVQTIGGYYFRNSKSVLFHPQALVYISPQICKFSYKCSNLSHKKFPNCPRPPL